MTYREKCERCGNPLAGTDVAYVCSYDCTFCSGCAPGMEGVCPNCGGELVRRPRRSSPALPEASSDPGGAEHPSQVSSSPGGSAPTTGRSSFPPRGSDVDIAPAEENDLLEIGVLFDAYRQFYRQPPDVPGAQAFLADRFRKRESVIFVARSRGNAIGFVQLFPTFSSNAMRRLWILNDLFVTPSYRGRGIGSLLLARSKEFARETGASGVILETALDNPAQKLYEAFGWRLDKSFLHYEWGTT